MNSPNTEKTLHNDIAFSHLSRLGWSSFFQQQLSSGDGVLPPARVIGVRKNIFLVNRGDEEIHATPAGRLFHEIDTCLPVVGDWVLLRESVITTVLPRRNVLSRREAGGRSGRKDESRLSDQVIAANLDTVFIVCGLDRDFNLRRIERCLTMVYNCGIAPVIVLTKADLHQDPLDFVEKVENIAFGVPVYPVSAHDQDGVARLKKLLPPGRTAALIGSSGAGKSTLINRLFGDEIRATGAVGDRVKKGRHITTTRDLIVLPTGGMVIDNPGIREIGLTIDDDSAESAFPDIESLAQFCRFSDCSHSHEPGCRVLEAVSCGEISSDRLHNYHKIKSELKYHFQREQMGAARSERERRKGIAQKRKSMKKRRKQ